MIFMKERLFLSFTSFFVLLFVLFYLELQMVYQVLKPSSSVLTHQSEICQHHPAQSGEISAVPNCLSPAPSSKPRMRWTPEMHEAFVEAVKQLGGSERM